ncbi:F-box only protein 33 [Belonocnema kinseyi]|uniref:F-box only protein 33 n=1 Tax=Belonocnema kinseyi TaxID=2817044 RepID=UPI00143CC0CC|nr:F-box only protein 33 [Belonocnema kinseyi]
MVNGKHADELLLEKSKNCEEKTADKEDAKNSCSSCKGSERTSEMAQDNSPCWDSLPSVILLEIFSYLPQSSRLRASQVCRNWRYALFHPSFWKKIKFSLKDEDSVAWSRFLVSSFGLSVHDVTISCETSGNYVKDAVTLLKKLSNNRQLRKLFLEPTSCMFDLPIRRTENEDDGFKAFSAPVMESLLKIMETTNNLEALSLGCIEELTASASVLLEPLQHYHAKHLTHLSLASIKDDPDHYDFLEFDCSVFSSFCRLRVLTVDYDYVSDILLNALDNGVLERLVIHIHGLDDDYPGTSNQAWENFTQKNPLCELRLNLIHAYVAVTVLDTDILQPAMPLTHLKVLFCEHINIGALHSISVWYPNTLRSLIWIDSIDPTKHLPATFDPHEPNNPDPLVFVAWKCTKLVEIVFIGHKYAQENLLAIARLRGNTLHRLEFAESDIATEESWYEGEHIMNEIKEILGGGWHPISDARLPTVVMDPLIGDSREVIMPMVLHDQK